MDHRVAVGDAVAVEAGVAVGVALASTVGATGAVGASPTGVGVAGGGAVVLRIGALVDVATVVAKGRLVSGDETAVTAGRLSVAQATSPKTTVSIAKLKQRHEIILPVAPGRMSSIFWLLPNEP